MAYKYFTKRLLQSGLVDLNSVFPEKQQVSKEQNNVAYSLPEIVDYLRTSTEEFRFADQKYIDLDNAIRAVISKYYTSKNETNPFDDDAVIIDDKQFQKGDKPREAAIVDAGGLKGKGVKSVKDKTEVPVPQHFVAPAEPTPTITITPEEPVVPIADIPPVSDAVTVPGEPEASIMPEASPVVTEVTPAEPPSQIEIKDAIEVLRFLADDGDQSATEAIEALELLLEDES